MTARPPGIRPSSAPAVKPKRPGSESPSQVPSPVIRHPSDTDSALRAFRQLDIPRAGLDGDGAGAGAYGAGPEGVGLGGVVRLVVIAQVAGLGADAVTEVAAGGGGDGHVAGDGIGREGAR